MMTISEAVAAVKTAKEVIVYSSLNLEDKIKGNREMATYFPVDKQHILDFLEDQAAIGIDMKRNEDIDCFFDEDGKTLIFF